MNWLKLGHFRAHNNTGKTGSWETILVAGDSDVIGALLSDTEFEVQMHVVDQNENNNWVSVSSHKRQDVDAILA